MINWRDDWQLGETVDNGKIRTSYRASYPNSDKVATSQNKEICSYDRRKRGENNRSKLSNNLDSEQVLERKYRKVSMLLQAFHLVKRNKDTPG